MSESAGKSDKAPQSRVPLPVWRLLLEFAWIVATLAAFSMPIAVKDRALRDEPHWYTGWGLVAVLYVVTIACLAIYATSRWRILRSVADTDRAEGRAAFWIGLGALVPLIVGLVFVFVDRASGGGLSDEPWSIGSTFLVAVARWRSEERLAEQAIPSAPGPR